MATDDRPRASMSQTRPAQSPEISLPGMAVTGSAPVALTDAEAILVHGMRLIQRVKAGGLVTAIDRAALSAMQEFLKRLQLDCEAVCESGQAKGAARVSSPRAKRSRAKTAKKSDTAESKLE